MAASKPVAALIVVDMQEDFCGPDGALAIEDGRDLAPAINDLLSWPGFAVKVGTRDMHPHDHVSFASTHANKKPFDLNTLSNPENEAETQTSYERSLLADNHT